MEIPTLSRQPHMVSKKSYNGGSVASSKSVYDDIFGVPPKFGPPTLSPRVEDYAEIFGGFRASRASSIPVLDLPLVDDDAADVFSDIRSSGFDYAEVFGGFNGHNLAVSYEDMMTMMEKSNGHNDSSDDAWTPAEADNLSEASDHSTKYQCFSNGDLSESIDDCTEFNISYNKAGKKCNENLSNGIRHATQLHDVSGCTFLVGKASSLPNSEYLHARDDDVHHIIDYSWETLSRLHPMKVMSRPANGSDDDLLFADDVVPHTHREFVGNGSTFFTISDVGLRTRPSDLPPPSRPPPALDAEKGYSDKRTSSCRSGVSEESSGDCSPYFDVEVDANSSAAASATAVKDAMKIAQAKLKSAKESMERKQEAFYRHSNSDSKNSRRDKDEQATKGVNGSGSIRVDGGGRGILHGEEENVIEFSVTEEKHKLKKTSQIISDSLEGNYRLNVEKKSAEENKGRGSLSSQGSAFIDVAGEWKEASQFFELVTNKSKKFFDQENDKTVLECDSKCFDRQMKEKRATVEGLQVNRENGVKVGAGRELEHPEITSEMPIRAYECDKSFQRFEVANKQKILVKRVQITEEACREERNEKKFSIDLHPVETEKRRIRAYDLQEHSDYIEVLEKADRQTMRHKDKGSQLKEINRSMGKAKQFCQGKEDNDGRSRIAPELEENEKKLCAAFDPAENEIRLINVTLWEEKEKIKKAVCGREENDKTFRESVEWKESERRRKEALEKEDNERRLKAYRENEQRLRRQREAAEWEENEKRQKETHEREEIEKKRREMLERGADEKEERRRRERKAIEQEENAKREREDNEKRRKQALQKEERERQEHGTRLKQAQEEMQRRQEEQENAKREREDDEMRLEKAQEETDRRQAAFHQQKNEKKQEEAFATENYERQQLEVSEMRCDEAFEREEIVERSYEACESETGERLEEVCQKPENGSKSGLLEEVEEIETDEEPEKISMPEAKCEWKETEMEHVGAVVRKRKTELKMEEDCIKQNQALRLSNNEINRVTKTTGKHENKSDLRNEEEAVTSGTEQKTIEKIKRYFQVNLDTGNQGEKFPHERVDLMSDGAVKEPVETERKIKVAQPAMEVKGSDQRAAQQDHARQSTEHKGKNNTLPQEDKESERMKRERDLELERLRKMEEEREREREREKDRMAVDRTILETRERVYAEARGRGERAAVERATAEVRQRALNDARERLEKACAEAREKSFLDDKVFVESRIRAERAAVERATAEARERAFEKVMAERTAFEARDRVERSASDQFSASSRNGAFRPNSASYELHNQQSQGAGISSGSKYQYSSVYGESFGVEGESPQRCKARLERHRRTAERAANALEELNMRNLHAQREQAEKNRLAETLDADVKRWSSGKEGNLRALLSTLQYILGPGSGWHPIHLTEVITAAAVKKAYRKATLCVHPDKLQQRGASIQQKYICEKVFDLLKEAWIRFNSEER